MKKRTLRSKEWFRTFFGGLYGRVLASQFAPNRSLRHAKLVKNLLWLRKGQAVLDCPCGQGRLTVPLAKMGLAATGVDLIGAFISKAKRAARRQRAKVNFIQQDMRQIEFDSEFDAAVNWFTSFGYFDDDGNLAFCRRILRALRPGGRFLIEVENRLWTIRSLHSGREATINGVRIVNRPPRYDGRTSRIHDTWVMSRGGRTERRKLSLRVYTSSEMRSLLRKAGFVDIRFWGHSRKGAGRLTRHSRRFIVVARKPAG